MFMFCLTVAMVASMANKQLVHQAALDHAKKDATNYQRQFSQGINSYLDFNLNLAGLFAADANVTRLSFERYLNTTKALERQPGVSYVGYIARISNTDRQDGYVFLYGYPHDERVKKAEGTDMSSVPERWTAMQQARDTGQSIATAKHHYRSDSISSPIVIVFNPVYDLKLPTSTVEQRRIALKGFTFAVLVFEAMVDRIMGPGFKSQFDLEAYDGIVSRQTILYDGDNEPHVVLNNRTLAVVHDEKVIMGGRDWHLFFYPKPIYLARYASDTSILILFLGLVIGFALSFLMWKWLRFQRIRAGLVEQSQRFEAIFEHHPSAVYSLDLQRRFINANAQALKEFNVSKETLRNMVIERLVVPENIDRMKGFFEDVLQGKSVSYESAIINAIGVRIEVSVIMIPVSVNGKITSVLGVAQNITDRKFAEWQLGVSKNMLQLVIDHIPQRVFWKNTELVYIGCNEAFAKDVGFDQREQIIGKTDFQLSQRSDAEFYRQSDRNVIGSRTPKLNYEEPQHRDGAESWVRTSKIPVFDRDGETVAILGVYEDITERKVFEQKLQSMAHYDSLTGLENRAFFYNHVEQAISKRRRHEATFLALMYLDLDKFKSINDRYGHAAGDALLKAFAGRIKAAVRANDMTARLGGDEFALLLYDLPTRAEAISVAKKIVKEMQTAFQIDQITLNIGTSIGIAFLETDMTSADLIAKADEAMYKAKQSGRNHFEVAEQPAL